MNASSGSGLWPRVIFISRFVIDGLSHESQITNSGASFMLKAKSVVCYPNGAPRTSGRTMGRNSQNDKFRNFARLQPKPISRRTTVEELIDSTFHAYNAARLREGCELFVEKMLP